MNKVLSEDLELKIAALHETTDRLEEKWGMKFPPSSVAWQRTTCRTVRIRMMFSYNVEQDFWTWEEAETLKAHYRQGQAEWT